MRHKKREYVTERKKVGSTYQMSLPILKMSALLVEDGLLACTE